MFKNLADLCVQGACHHVTSHQGQFIVWILAAAAVVWVLSRIFKS